jgi:hypothetical protein
MILVDPTLFEAKLLKVTLFTQKQDLPIIT